MIGAALLAGLALAAALVRPASRLARRIRHERAVNKAARAADERMVRRAREDTAKHRRVRP